MNLCDIRTVRDILAAFGTGTKKGFGQNFLINAAVTSCGHDARIRGERLSTAEFAALADALLPLLS